VYSGRAVRAGRWKEEKNGQDRKKVTKGLYFTYLGRSPIDAIYMKKMCIVGDVLDLITCAKFQKEILGVTILQGVELSIFLLIFEWALQQCSATQLPVIPVLLLISQMSSGICR